MKILIIALSGIGDALMFTPTLEKIKKEFPQAEIDVLTMFKGVQDIYALLDDVANVFFFNFIKEGAFKSLSYVLKLRKAKYDISVNVYPSNRKEYNIISRIVGANKRLAVRYIRQDIANLGFLNNCRIDEDDNTHNVQTNFKMFESISNNHSITIPPLRLTLNSDHLAFANDFLKNNNISESELVVGFHTGSNTFKNLSHKR